MKQVWMALSGVLWAWGVSACTPGYIKSSELEIKGQGPAACSKACTDIGMRMTAMVLVGDTVPGCVCQPVTVAPPTPPVPAGAAPVPAPAAGSPEHGAAASPGGYVVMAAAAAPRQQQEQQRMQQQQMYKH